MACYCYYSAMYNSASRRRLALAITGIALTAATATQSFSIDNTKNWLDVVLSAFYTNEKLFDLLGLPNVPHDQRRKVGSSPVTGSFEGWLIFFGVSEPASLSPRKTSVVSEVRVDNDLTLFFFINS